MSSKPAKPAEAADAPKKSNKMLIIIIAAVVLLGGGGAAAFVLMKPHPPKHPPAAAAEEEPVEEEEDAHHKIEPKFVELGTFTANLIHEEGDRYLQVAISIKLTKPELEEKMKARNPEIMHKVNMLLQSRTPSELGTLKGKEKLAGDIKAQVEYVLGLRKTAPVITASIPVGQQSETEPVEHAAPTQHVAEHEGAESGAVKKGVADVFFTSFIIQ
ncbi:MAG: hypothetical protein RL358_663 [Pseudomonadota bacterium]|jgi:flagellar FliL protein